MKTRITNWLFLMSMFIGLAASAQTARVQVIHNSPDALAAEVDIWLGDMPAVQDLGFREATSFLDIPAESEVVIGIAPGDSDDPSDIIATFPVTLMEDGTYIVMATGLLDNVNYTPFQPFTLAIFDMGQESSMMAGNVDLLVYHGSTDAPTVDVVEGLVGLGTAVDGLSYGEFTASYLELPEANYGLSVTLDDGTPTGLQYSAPLADLGLAGGAGVVFASGFLNPFDNNNGAAFGLFVALPDGSVTQLPEWSPTATVQVIHNCADALAETVDIWVNGGPAIQDLSFREATSFLELPAASEIEIGVAPGDSDDPSDIIATFPVTLAPDGSYVVMATGLLDDMNYDPFEAFTLEIYDMAQQAAMMAGNVDLLVYHGSTDAPTVDVNEIGVGLGVAVDDISYGEFTDGYLALPTDDYILNVTLSDGTNVGLQYEAPLETLGLDGGAAVVFASGFLDPSMNNDGAGFGLWVALPDGSTLPLPVWEPTANVQVIHNSADALAAAVDIWINGEPAVQDLAFRAATPFVALPAYNEIEIGIAPADSETPDDIIATFPATLDPDGNYIVMATGLLDDMNYDPFEAFTLAVYDMAQQAAMMAGNVDLLVYHGSTDAPTVDVNEVGVGLGTAVDDISYGDFTDGYLALPTDDYILDVTLFDGTNVGLQYEAPLETLGLDGGAAVVFASGFLNPSNNNDGAGFGLWVALPDGSTLPLPVWEPTARVQVIHNSADALAATVDIWLNGEAALQDVNFRDATGFIDLPAYNEIEIGVAPGDSDSPDDIIATFPFTLEPDGSYIVMATGLLDDMNYTPFEPFTLAVYDMAREAAAEADNTDLLVYHGSTDAPTVDVYEAGIGAGELINDIAYGNFTTDYLELPTDDYYVQIRLEDGETVVVTYEALLETLALNDGAAVVFASGFLDPSNNNDGPAFGLWVALPDGTTLPLTALGTAPENNVCSAATPLTVEMLADCPDNAVSGTIANAWNDFGVPGCELPGLLPGVYYSFNTGTYDIINVNIEAIDAAGPEIGFVLLDECGVEAGIDGSCVFNASVQGTITVEGLTAGEDYTLLIFSNLDFGNNTGEFNLCVSGDVAGNVASIERAELFSLYPNPNNGEFNINYSGDSEKMLVEVLNLNGQLIYSEQLSVNNGSTHTLDLDLAGGVYNIRMISDNGVQDVKRFIVE